MHRRTLLAATLAAPSIAPSIARAQDTRSVRIIIPYAPGGSSDLVGRILAQHATQAGGQGFVVENRGGGASVPGTQAVAGAPPDGLTIGTADNALVVNQALLKERLPYDVTRDIAAIGLAVTAPSVLLAHPSATAHTLADVMADLRANPGMGLSHGGIGTPSHLAALQFQIASGLEFTMVGYRGGGPQLTGLVGGEVRYGFAAISAAFGQLQSGRVRPIAVSGPSRSTVAPTAPTITEAGLPGVDVVGWWGFIAPGATPAPVLDRLNAQLVAPAREPAMRARLEALGYAVVAGSPQDYAALIRREVPEWRAVFEKAGVKSE